MLCTMDPWKTGVFLVFMVVYSIVPNSGAVTWQPSGAQTVGVVKGSTAFFVWKIVFDNTIQGIQRTDVLTAQSQGGDTSTMIYKLKDSVNATVGSTFKSREKDLELLVLFNTTIHTATIRFTLHNVNLTADDGRTLKVSAVLIPTYQPVTSADTTLVVQVRVHNFVGPQNITKNEFEQLNLTCSADGKPLPQLTMVLPNGEQIIGVSPLTVLRTAYRNMTGMYNCTAENEVTAPQTKSALLNILFPPGVTCSNKTVVENDKQQARLICSVDGNPPPDMMWRRNGTTVGIGRTLNKTSLRSNSGFYTFVANNSLDTRRMEVLLTVQYPPDCSVSVQPIKVIKPNAMIVKCNPSYGQPRELTATLLYPLGRLHGLVLNVTNTNQSYDGWYNCTVDNGIGTPAMCSENIIVWYKPEFSSPPVATPSEVCLHQSINLDCKADGYPGITNYTFYDGNTYLGYSTSGSFQTICHTVGRRNFSCIAKNSEGTGITSVQVKVIESPKIGNCSIDGTVTKGATVVEGENVILRCEILGDRPQNVTLWLNGRNIVMGSNGTHQFTPVNRRDYGTYKMVVSNRCNTTEETLTLTVHFPASCSFPQDMLIVNEGMAANLSISTTGNPPVNNYIWTHPNGSRLVGNNVLRFIALRQDTGTYHCSVYNDIGERANCTRYVNVKYPLKCEIYPSTSIVKVNENDQVSLTCISDGNPEASDFIWTYPNGSSLPGSSTLHYTASRKDVKLFHCSVSNGVGDRGNCSRNITVQYLDDIKVTGSNNKTYSQSNTVAWFNLTVDAYPRNVSFSCESPEENILTFVISIKDVRLNGKEYLVFVIIKTPLVNSASVTCKAKHVTGEREKRLYIYRQPTIVKKTLPTVFKITNQEWQEELQYSESFEYKNLKTKCTKILNAAYDGIPYLAAKNITGFRHGSVIVRFELEVPDPLQPLKTYIKEKGREINGLQIDTNSIEEAQDNKENLSTQKEDSQTPVAVLGALFALSIVLNVVLIASFFWLRRKDLKETSKQRNKEYKGQMNMTLQGTSFNDTDNVAPNTAPEYEPIGRRGLASNSSVIQAYEAVASRTQSPRQPSGVQTDINPLPQYEKVDRQEQEKATISDLSPITYQAVQPHCRNYESLSHLTRLPPKGTLSSPTSSTGEYQSLQLKGLSPHYQALDELNRC